MNRRKPIDRLWPAVAVLVATALLVAGCTQAPATGGTVQPAGLETPVAPVAVTATPAPVDHATAPAVTVRNAATTTVSGMAGMDHGTMMNPDQPFDAQFIDSMIEHHQGAIAMALQALQEAEREELRTLAEEIIAAQEGEIAQMEAWRAEWYPNLERTQGMGMALGAMTSSRDDSLPFDRRFAEAMISHHRGAIAMAQMALQMAEHEEVRTLAQEIIEAQEGEITQLHEWLNAWRGVAAPPLITAVDGAVWVANEGGNSLTVVDAVTGEVVTTLTGIEGPHNVQVAPDGRTVWAVSGHDALAVAVDAQTYELLSALPVGSSPAHVIVAPDGKTAWVSNSGDNTVSVIDTTTFEVVQTVPVGDFPHGLRPSPDGSLVAVANLRGNSVSLIDTVTYRVQEVQTGEGPVQVAFAPDGAALYVSLNGEDMVARIDPAAATVVGTAAVGDGPLQLSVTPDGTMVLVAIQGTEDAPGSTLAVVEAEGMTQVASIETGEGAHGVAVEPSGQYAYVTNLYDNTLAVVDLAALQTVARVPTGIAPNGVSFSALQPGEGPPEIPLPLEEHDDSGAEGGEGESDEHEAEH